MSHATSTFASTFGALIGSLIGAAITLGAARPAAAWESETTQAGLAEQAALASALHHRLVALGFGGGLFEPLTIPPADAPALLDALRLLSPTHGAVPDARGRQPALGWLAAGAAIADLTGAAHHFYDPLRQEGWRRPAGLLDALRERLPDGAAIPTHGVAAPDWVVSPDNPLGLDGFLAQYAKAVSAATPGERARHMAGALVAAGAMLHALGDLGAPARVRGDAEAQLEPLGGGAGDLGSRFERIAALAYGRLGVPGPSRVVTRDHLRAYFTAADGTGLAELIGRAYFSPGTLPTATKISHEATPTLARPAPTVPARLNLMAASRDDGATLRDAAGTCLARYRVERSTLTFHLDDDCLLEQVTAILPEVAAYETGLLDFLFRGELTIAASGGQVTVTAAGLGAGRVELLVEDARGVRASLGAADLAAGHDAALLALGAPSAGARVVAVFRGRDAAGEPVVAVGAMALER
jgi:hypothetical protein